MSDSVVIYIKCPVACSLTVDLYRSDIRSVNAGIQPVEAVVINLGKYALAVVEVRQEAGSVNICSERNSEDYIVAFVAVLVVPGSGYSVRIVMVIYLIAAISTPSALTSIMACR